MDTSSTQTVTQYWTIEVHWMSVTAKLYRTPMTSARASVQLAMSRAARPARRTHGVANTDRPSSAPGPARRMLMCLPPNDDDRRDPPRQPAWYRVTLLGALSARLARRV